MTDTIYALATARGRAGIAVVRVSGSAAFSVVEGLTKRTHKPRLTQLCRLYTAAGDVLDEALVIVFEENASYTGENVAELHLHGSAAVISAVLKELAKHPETRLAEPGEFTRRALENGCLDLSQVEGLGDLLEAETEAQRRQAFRVMQGALTDKVEIWRRDLIRSVALLEATIDFVDEEVPVNVFPEVRELLEKTTTDLQMEIQGSYTAERIRDGFEVAIIGPPNIGKSTLLNRMARRDAALTSEIAGTTRDVIEVRMDLDGLPVTLLDTAGLRETTDYVENLGIDRARQRAEMADLRIFLTEDGDLSSLGVLRQDCDIAVLGKGDLILESDTQSISGKTGQGIDNLVKKISAVLSNRAGGSAVAIRERHRLALENAVVHLVNAIGKIESAGEMPELVSGEIHAGISALNSLIGLVDVDHVLDEIFSSFCLGK